MQIELFTKGKLKAKRSHNGLPELNINSFTLKETNIRSCLSTINQQDFSQWQEPFY